MQPCLAGSSGDNAGTAAAGGKRLDGAFAAAAGLGGLGRDDQLKQLAATEALLAAHAAEAAANFTGSEKMWRYLGVLSGMAVVILLL